MKRLHAALLTAISATMLSACANLASVADETREHDKRNGFVAAIETTFPAIFAPSAERSMVTSKSRWI